MAFYQVGSWRGSAPGYPQQQQAQRFATVQTEAVQSCQAMVDQVKTMIQALTKYGELVAALAVEPRNRVLAKQVESYNIGVGQMHNLLKIAASERRIAKNHRALELAATEIVEFECGVAQRLGPEAGRALAPHVENMKRVIQGGSTCTVLPPRMAPEEITEGTAADGMGYYMAAQHNRERRRQEVAADARGFDEQHSRRLAKGTGKHVLRGNAARVPMQALQQHVPDGPKFMADEVRGQSMADGARFYADGTGPDLLDDRKPHRSHRKKGTKSSSRRKPRAKKGANDMDVSTSESDSEGSLSSSSSDAHESRGAGSRGRRAKKESGKQKKKSHWWTRS